MWDYLLAVICLSMTLFPLRSLSVLQARPFMLWAEWQGSGKQLELPYRVREAAFRTPKPIRQSYRVQSILFRTRNKINSDMNRMAVTHVKVQVGVRSPCWSLGIANLRNAFTSKPNRIAWTAHSREKPVPQSLSFSGRSGFCRCRIVMWLKAFCKILTVAFSLLAVRSADCGFTGQRV